jgi:hypothetical protein
MTDQRLDTDAPMTAADALSSGLVPADGGPPPTARELELLRQLERKQQEVDDLAVSSPSATCGRILSW